MWSYNAHMPVGLQIERLYWDEWNIDHIAKHDVMSEEAEEVVAGDPVVRATYKQRFQLIGPSLSNRILSVNVGQVPGYPGIYYVFSARPASRKERRFYAEQAEILCRAKGRPHNMTRKKPSVDLGYPTEPHGRIPSFNNIEEEAAFWDTHDVTDFLEESQPAELDVGPELAEKLTLRLERSDREALIRRARRMGIGPSTLARIWIKERLHAGVDS